ncbi:MAG: ERCC4 domain-containing protein [Pedobacter sp.]|uniref:ERCC4 domain-containing protein n=1 Tax=Pedobacter sp. TaxID=1411316 RepID=UPI00356341BD
MARLKTYPVIFIDTREQLPYEFKDYGVVTQVETIHAGDYSCGTKKGDVITRYLDEISIERKTLDNWVGDISSTEGRERLEASILMGSKKRYYAVFIEATSDEVFARKYKSLIPPQTVIDTAIRWSVKYKVPIEFVGDRTYAEYRTYEALMGFLDYKKRGIL